MNSDFTIIIDTREQKPYDFLTVSSPPPKTIRKKLDSGDYSILGIESLVCCERKELSDLFSSVGKGRKRLEAEFERMSKMDYAVLLIENDYRTMFINPPVRSKMQPKSVFRSLITWSQRYNIHIWNLWNREAAEKTCYLILKRYWDDLKEEKRK